MKQKLNYNELTRLDTHIRKDLYQPLHLVQYLGNKTISQITSEALEQFLGAELEGLLGETSNEYFVGEIRKWLNHFGRL